MPDLIGSIRDSVLARLREHWHDIDSLTWAEITNEDRQTVYRAVIEGLIGKSDSAVVTALVNAVADDKLTGDEAIEVLRAWARQVVGGNAIAQMVIDALEDRTVTSDELTRIALSFAAGKATNPRAKAALEALKDQQNAQALWEAILTYLEPTENTRNVLDVLKGVVESGSITKEQLAQLLAAWASASGLTEISDLLSHDGDLQKALQSWLIARISEEAGVTAVELEALLKALQEGDWLALLTSILGMLHLTLGKELVEDYAGGTLKTYLIDKLADLLQQAKVKSEDADVVAQAIARFVSGGLVLFAPSPESDAPELTEPTDIAGFRHIRSVIYLAQLVTFGGRIVPTEPMAPPHIFLAARIRYSTKLKDLVPAGASPEKKKDFCNNATAMFDAHFAPYGFRPYAEDHQLAFNLAHLASDEDFQRVFSSIEDRFPSNAFPAALLRA